ncbi:MAG: hypothetical protein Q8P61_01935 [Candidatus Nanopelagicales bacterium]|nr:hypothetical protein [Candidatus Nanopelagicales bacterium]
MHPDYLTRLRDVSLRLLSRQVAGWRGEVRLIGSAGQAVQALVLASTSFDQAGQPGQVLVQVEDISAQKQLLEAITRSNSDLQRFAPWPRTICKHRSGRSAATRICSSAASTSPR